MKKRWAITRIVKVEHGLVRATYAERPPRGGFTTDYRRIWRFKSPQDAEKAAFTLSAVAKGELIQELAVVRLPGKVPMSPSLREFRARVKRALGVKEPKDEARRQNKPSRLHGRPMQDDSGTR
jgi:hypothetical protein